VPWACRMFNYMVEHSDPLDLAYAALAHPTRRAMLRRLTYGEARVTELARPFAVSLAAASKHIGQLERSGLVTRRIVGRDHWIALEPEPLEDAARWLALYRPFWERRLDALEALVTEADDADG
jgi:DNA-binding transcriptional ArsR family regulator